MSLNLKRLENDEDVYEVADKVLSDDIIKGLSTPALAKEAGDALLEQIILFGGRMGDEAANDLWRALKWETP